MGSSQQQLNNEWFNNIPQEYQERPSIAAFKDKGFEDFIKDYVNKDSLVGRKGVLLPKEDDDEDLNRFYSELGRPETPENYENIEVVVPEEIKDFVDLSEVDNFKGLAHKYGLNNKQFQGLVKDYVSQQIGKVKQAYEEQIQKANEAKTTLRNEWGEKTDERIAKAQSIIDKFADETSYEFFNKNNKDVGLIRFLDKIAQNISSDVIDPSGTQQTKMTPEQIQKRMDEILRTDDFWINVPTAGSQNLKKEYEELSKMLK